MCVHVYAGEARSCGPVIGEGGSVLWSCLDKRDHGLTVLGQEGPVVAMLWGGGGSGGGRAWTGGVQ